MESSSKHSKKRSKTKEGGRKDKEKNKDKAIVVSRAEESPFLNNECRKAYIRFTNCGITDSKVIIPSSISFDIMSLFIHTSLAFLVTLEHPYHPLLFYQFLANLSFSGEKDLMSSYVMGRHVDFTESDLENILHLSRDGPIPHLECHRPGLNWTGINNVLRNSNLHQHDPRVHSMLKDPRIVQHVLRHAVIPKAGDRIHITPLLSMITYYIITQTNFNSASLILRYFDSLQIIRNPDTKKKYNIGLGHVVAYLLKTKYDIVYPEAPTHRSVPFTNSSFHIFYSKTRADPAPTQVDVLGEDVPDTPEDRGAPSSTQYEDLKNSFDQFRLEVHNRWDLEDVRREIDDQRWAQHRVAEEQRWAQHQQDEERHWAQLFSYFPPQQPPPSPGRGPDYI